MFRTTLWATMSLKTNRIGEREGGTFSQCGEQRVLSGPGRAKWAVWRRSEALQPRTGHQEEVEGSVWAAPLSARPSAGRPAPLCDPRRCARGGGGGGEDREGSGGRGSFLRSQPRPPAHWLGAAALWRVRSKALDRERRDAEVLSIARGLGAPLRQSCLSGAHICSLVDLLPLQGKTPTCWPHCHCPRAPLPLSGGPGRLT